MDLRLSKGSITSIDKKPGFLLQNSLENVLSYLTDTEFHANIESTRQMLKTMLKDERRKREKTEQKLGNIESKLDTLMEQIGNGRLNTRRSGYSSSRRSSSSRRLNG